MLKRDREKEIDERGEQHLTWHILVHMDSWSKSDILLKTTCGKPRSGKMESACSSGETSMDKVVSACCMTTT